MNNKANNKVETIGEVIYFRLKTQMSNDEIAERLGADIADKTDFCTEDRRRFLGQRISEDIFSIVADMTKMHELAGEFAEEIKKPKT